MRYLTLGEVVALHRAVIESTGGATGLRHLAALESAVAQPRATFDGVDLHPTVTGKAAALAYSLALNHTFVDGNKRVAHAAMEVFLTLNGLELHADVDDALQGGRVTPVVERRPRETRPSSCRRR